MRFSRAKPTGSFRVFQPGTRAVASHEETLKDAQKSANYWTRAVSSTMEIQERFPSGAWVTVETVTPDSLRTGKGRSKKRTHATVKASGPTRLPDDVAKAILVGDRVTIVDRFGKQRTGRAVMKGPHGWVLNMGGKHGTPGIATSDNVVAVRCGKK